MNTQDRNAMIGICVVIAIATAVMSWGITRDSWRKEAVRVGVSVETV